MSGLFEGKTALITGAGSGIGRATALAFARAGARVVVSDSIFERCEQVVAEIAEGGGTACAIRCDVRERDEIAALVSATIKQFGRIDCAFNNAGIGGPIQPFSEFAEDQWDAVIRTNLTSTFLCMKHQISHMLEHGNGTIVNCGSISGLAGSPGMAAYCASKFGIIGLTKAAAREYAEKGIRVNAVCPGTIHTPAVDAFLKRDGEVAEAFIATKKAAQPMGRLGTTEEVAEAVLWLSSPGASFTTGHCLAVDGGKMA